MPVLFRFIRIPHANFYIDQSLALSLSLSLSLSLIFFSLSISIFLAPLLSQKVARMQNCVYACYWLEGRRVGV